MCIAVAAAACVNVPKQRALAGQLSRQRKASELGLLDSLPSRLQKGMGFLLQSL